MDLSRPSATSPPVLPNDHSKCPTLVLIFTDCDELGQTVIRGLVKSAAYLRNSRGLPVLLILGMKSASINGIHGILSRDETTLLQVQTFRLNNSRDVIDRIFVHLFLSKSTSPLRLGRRILKWLEERFLNCEFSVHGFLRTLKVCLKKLVLLMREETKH